MTEATAKSGAYARAGLACAGVYRRFQTRTGARRHSGADLGVFAATVCVQAMCRVLGPAEKLPAAVFEAATRSFACLRVVGCAYGRVWVFQTVLGCRRL
jgi:hypothetical protein